MKRGSSPMFKTLGSSPAKHTAETTHFHDKEGNVIGEDPKVYDGGTLPEVTITPKGKSPDPAKPTADPVSKTEDGATVEVGEPTTMPDIDVFWGESSELSKNLSIMPNEDLSKRMKNLMNLSESNVVGGEMTMPILTRAKDEIDMIKTELYKRYKAEQETGVIE